MQHLMLGHATSIFFTLEVALAGPCCMALFKTSETSFILSDQLDLFCCRLVLEGFTSPDRVSMVVRVHPATWLLFLDSRWPAPLYNLYFDSFLLICTSFVVKTRGIVCVVYPLSRLANYRDSCKRCVLAT